MGAHDHDGKDGESDDDRAERLAPLAVQALRKAGDRVQCALAVMPGELVYHDINGYEATRRRRKKLAKSLRLKPLLPGYFLAGFTTDRPDWSAIMDLAGGLEIYGAVTWTTIANPGGEPRPFTYAQMAAFRLLLDDKREVALIGGEQAHAPEHHKFQTTGAEFELGEVVEIKRGHFAGFRGPVRRLSGASAWVEIEVFGGPTEVEADQDMLAPVKERRAA